MSVDVHEVMTDAKRFQRKLMALYVRRALIEIGMNWHLGREREKWMRQQREMARG